MVPIDRLLPFALAAWLFVLLPGPSVLFVIGRGLALGRRAAVATVLGNAAGFSVHVLLVVAGLGAVLARSVVLFESVRLAGAAYLVWLGVQAWRHRHAAAAATAAAQEPVTLARAVREGFLVGLGNPKSVVFVGAILPQFVDPAVGRVPLQLFVLGMVLTSIAIVSDSMYGIAAGSARRWLAASPRRLARLGGAGGVAMIGLGVGLAVTGRPQR